jgi:hypothetical protein
MELGNKLQITVHDTRGATHMLTYGTRVVHSAGRGTDRMYNLTGHLSFLRTYGLEAGDVMVFR